MRVLRFHSQVILWLPASRYAIIWRRSPLFQPQFSFQFHLIKCGTTWFGYYPGRLLSSSYSYNLLVRWLVGLTCTPIICESASDVHPSNVLNNLMWYDMNSKQQWYCLWSQVSLLHVSLSWLMTPPSSLITLLHVIEPVP